MLRLHGAVAVAVAVVALSDWLTDDDDNIHQFCCSSERKGWHSRTSMVGALCWWWRRPGLLSVCSAKQLQKVPVVTRYIYV